MATGTTESPLSTEPVSPFARLDRPAVLLVGEQASPDEEYEEALKVVFTNEKICSAMRAFRPLRMTVLDASEDPFIAQTGDEVPRILVIDPVTEKIEVLGKSKLKASALFREMARASKRVWKENLGRTVKTHLKLLVKRDTLHDLLTVTNEKLARLEEDEDADKRAELEAEIRRIEAELQQLRVEEKELWTLTRKWTPPAGPGLETEGAEPPLPPGWKRHKTSDGKTYYERPDGSTTWDRPPAAS